jgi:hypothetical protein
MQASTSSYFARVACQQHPHRAPMKMRSRKTFIYLASKAFCSKDESENAAGWSVRHPMFMPSEPETIVSFCHYAVATHGQLMILDSSRKSPAFAHST